ncbi:MAG: phosphate signaling complex protein PhoU [Candidatus Bathyarchaeia archaeon]
MNRLLDVGLEQLTVIVFKMGEVAERAIGVSIRGFMKGQDVTGPVHDLSDMLNTMTVEVEDKAFELIVKYQPVASDLRIINSYIKIAYDFERYGRYAWDISFTHKKIAQSEPCHDYLGTMNELTEKVSSMVTKSILALKRHDAELAKTLASTENEVDDLYFKFLSQISEVPIDKKFAMCNLLISRFLERIADHATYVCESVIYMVTGEKISLR